MTMIKFKLYFDKDKETVWLNEMAQKGYAMTGFFAGFYRFEKCEPGEYIYQVDFGEKFGSVSDNYREFMEETKIEIVQTWGFWVILRKKASEGEFVLYTDVDSNIAHYTKIRTLFKAVGILECICFLIETICIAKMPEEEFSYIYIAMLLLLALFIVVFLRMVVTTNQIITKLKERKGEPAPNNCNRNGAHPVLLSGMFLNCVALFMPEEMRLRMVLQIAAIILMITGLYLSRHIFTGK